MTNIAQKQADQNQNASVKSKGKSVDEAIKYGLAALNTTADQVDIEVINEGSRGILGIGAEDAEVKLTLKPELMPETDPVEETSPVLEVVAEDTSDAPETGDSFDADLAKHAEDILQELLTKMGVEATVSSRIGTDLVESDEEPPLTLDVSGEDLGLLIGRRGETLRALQFITRQILNKDAGRWVPAIVDVESYLVRRRRTLQQLATRMADRVVFSGRRVMMEPMPANERRIIHMQLRNHDKVYTQSTGEGERRKVVILPK